MKKMLALVSLALGMSAPGAQAHGFWIMPSSTVLSATQFVTFDAATSTEPFQIDHRPLAIDGLVILAPDGSQMTPVNVLKGELRTVFDAKFDKKGTYRVELVRSGFRASWKDSDNKPKRFMGTAEALAKEVPADAKDLNISETESRLENYITLGKPSALKPSNKGLELVASTHPNDLVTGEPVELTFLVDGKPTADVEVAIVRGQIRYRNNPEEQSYKTDKNGKIKVTFDQAGMYWLDADFKDGHVSNKIAKERTLSYVLTLEVLPQ
ncbi:Uncharacterized conserved protein, contains GH25 family domain [Methylophilus rhizosphaerae]|uniref:Uncharacterized conserved protein, contains GH25 family domain n=1 Tax=Methylophilus rhizosphaerae TaxID=492660 RepID=A0A1G9D167_9PROT|nr:DUF4198 domain-containing protein [Methylophilus rhizosphaerae]SDK57434.1 Uncharacterized conserved protein, contains GH25 family domain [Methylophilus rhizosphaerae]